jgi:hypothetical protein
MPGKLFRPYGPTCNRAVVSGLGRLCAYMRLPPRVLTSGDGQVARGDSPEPQPRVASGRDEMLDSTAV